MAKLPIIRSNHGALVSVAVFLTLFLLSGQTASMGTAVALMVPMLIYFLGTAALCTTLVTAGIAPAAAGLLLCALTYLNRFGGMGTAYLMMYLAPSLILFAFLYKKKVPFWKTVGLMIGMQVLSQLAVVILMAVRTEGQLFLRAGEMVKNAVEKDPLGDTLLLTFNQLGLIGLSSEQMPDALQEVFGGYMLSDAARQDLLLSLSALVRNTLPVIIPSLLITHSIGTGVLSTGFSLHRGKLSHQKWQARNVPDRQNPPVDQLGMPKLATWFIPRGWGLKIGILGLGYFFSLAENNTLTILGQMFYGVFNVVFSIQGIALINFIQHRKGVRRGWRTALPIIFALLLPDVLMILGAVDQMTNMRMLRPLPPEAEEMLRQRMREMQEFKNMQDMESKDREENKNQENDDDDDDDDDHQGGIV